MLHSSWALELVTGAGALERMKQLLFPAGTRGHVYAQMKVGNRLSIESIWEPTNPRSSDPLIDHAHPGHICDMTIRTLRGGCRFARVLHQTPTIS